MHASSTLGPLLLTLSLAGCASPPAERIGATSSAITSGAPADDDASVWIVGKLKGQTGYCSGVVISPHVVLTAAHCAPDNAAFTIFLGVDYNDAAAKARAENSVAVVAQHRHPDWDPVANLHDIAVLVTDAPIPRAPAAINREPLTSKDRGAEIRVVGFGQTSASDKTIGRRHTATTTIDAVDATGLAMKGAPSFCFFDSGGPTYMKRGDREVVVGVHSIMESKECDGVAWDGRVDVHAAFLDAIVAKVDPTAPDADGGAADGGGGDPAPAAPPAAAPPASEGGCATGPSRDVSGGGLLLAAAATALLVRRKRSRIVER